MAYDGRVYQILIASPSDVEEEREIAVRVIHEWNDLHSYTRRVVLLPLRWETHTAPEYGTRPQEVINRAIVDQCDLLVGIFWTRIGSPTGKADSGTLEEIERVGNAGKPIMLYFSKVGIDPDKLDLAQIDRLKKFKEKTYPNSLVESYKSIIEFRDKFARQLELKIRELQKHEDGGPPPLQLSFVSLESGDLTGTQATRKATVPMVTDPESIERLAENDPQKVERLRKLVDRRIDTLTSLPLVMAIQNSSATGLRNVYVELTIRPSSTEAQVLVDGVAVAGKLDYRDLLPWNAAYRKVTSPFAFEVMSKLENLQSEGELKRDGDSWTFSFEWGAIQPQRTRIIKPYVFITTKESMTIDVTARVFADGFPEPISLNAVLTVNAEPTAVTIDELVPDAGTILKRQPILLNA